MRQTPLPMRDISRATFQGNYVADVLGPKSDNTPAGTIPPKTSVPPQLSILQMDQTPVAEFPKMTGRQALQHAVELLVSDSHGASVLAGWHSDPQTGRRRAVDVPQKLCLIHSEISEAMEAHRKSLNDDKLTHRLGIEVELADALIRICDLAGALGLDLAGAYVEKRAYNDVREDHKLEARRANGGKAY